MQNYMLLGACLILTLALSCKKKGLPDSANSRTSITTQIVPLPNHAEQVPIALPPASQALTLIETIPALGHGPISPDTQKLILKMSDSLTAAPLTSYNVIVSCTKLAAISKGVIPSQLNVVGATIEVALSKGLANDDSCYLVLRDIAGAHGGSYTTTSAISFATTSNPARIPRIIASSSGANISKISWTPIVDALSYTVKWFVAGSPDTHLETNIAASRNCWLHKGVFAAGGLLNPGELLYYSVAAETELGNSGYSSPVAIRGGNVGSVTPECDLINEEMAKAPPELVSFSSLGNSGQTVNLSILARNSSQLYLTNNFDCVTGGLWETFRSSYSNWPLMSDKGISKIYMKMKSETGVVSDCFNLAVMPSAPFAKLSEFNLVTSDLNVFENSLETVFQSEGTFFGISNNKVYRSVDGAETWQLSGAFAKLYNFHVDATRLYLATDSGLYLSQDQGQTWVNRKPAGENSDNTVVDVFAAGDAVYALLRTGLALSKDQGMSWTTTLQNFPEVRPTLPNTITVFNGKVYVASKLGILVSSDEGKNWVVLNEINGLIGGQGYSLEISGSKLYAVCGGEAHNYLCSSSDGGSSWGSQYFADSEGPLYINTIYFAAGKIFLGTERGLYYSVDNGRTWNDQNTTFPFKSSTKSIAVTGDIWILASLGTDFMVSRDGGRTLRPKYSTFHANALTSLGELLLVSSNTGLYTYSSINDSWTYASKNKGLPSSDVFGVTMDGTRFYAATSQGLAMSIDKARTWTPIPGPIGSAASLQFAAENGHIYLAAAGGLFHTDDFGVNWLKIAIPDLSSGLSSIAVHGSELTAGAEDGSVFLSKDGGASWIIIKTGIRLAIENLRVLNSDLLTLHRDLGLYSMDLNAAQNNSIKINETSGSAFFADGTCYLLGIDEFKMSDGRCLNWVGQVYKKSPTTALNFDVAAVGGGSIYGLEKVPAGGLTATVWKNDLK